VLAQGLEDGEADEGRGHAHRADPAGWTGISMPGVGGQGMINSLCNPKYMLEKQMTRPTPRPTRIPRRVKFCGSSS
jgi:hypothetical protein